MSKLIKGLTVLAVLVSGAAFAGERCNTNTNTNNGYHPASSVDTYGNAYGTTVAVAPPPPPAGHYEVRQVRTFIPAHWTFIMRGHHRVRVFNPSHYEMVAQRIWVNGPAYSYNNGTSYQYGIQVAPPPPAFRG